jgi:hypothetical protein
MRATWAKATVLAALTAACSSTGVGHGVSVSPPAPSLSASPTDSPTPSAADGPESPLTTGVANLTVTGDLTQNLVFRTVEAPAVWAPPPAPMDITWSGGNGREFRLFGTSFVSRVETSADQGIALVLQGPDGVVEFNSTAGECDVTITPALPDNMGGLFTCTAFEDLDRAVTIDVRGTFTATG